MSPVSWTHNPPHWIATVDGQTVSTLKGKDIGGWTATWAGDRLWPAPPHMPKAMPQPMRFFPNLDAAKAAVEAAWLS